MKIKGSSNLGSPLWLSAQFYGTVGFSFLSSISPNLFSNDDISKDKPGLRLGQITIERCYNMDVIDFIIIDIS